MPPLTDDTVSRSFSRSNELQARLNKLVPGGAHTYARGPDQYPDFMAPVLVRGKAPACGMWMGTASSNTAWASGP